MTHTNTRTALITGASRGLGLALARGLARNGWNLIIDARGADALEAARAELASMTTVTAIPGDVTDAGHRTELASAAHEMGGLDAVINNAGILGPSPQPELLDYPLDVLEDVYRANVIAPLGVLQAVRDQLKPGAAIVNITSDAGVEPYPGWGGYGSGKAALEHLSAIFAVENPALRVYWIDPGDMQTQMHQDAFPGEDISDRDLPEASVPGLIALLDGDYTSGRYKAQRVGNVETGVREMRIALTVEDFDAAVSFYRDGLGLPLLNDWSTPEQRGILLDAGRATLELFDEAQAQSVDMTEVGHRSAGPVRLAFEVADLDTASADGQSGGAAALHAPVVTPWGDRNQRLQAPDGLHITLFEVTESQVEAVD
jgi:NAD(P)-dependent dehydrogenase (short-subunit alcohol dehydrogenase family)